MNLLNEENPVHIFLNKIGDIIIANLLFILCCIPVITIGPALTALYHCMLRTVKGNNNGTVKTFFRAFKENFIQSLVVWLCLLAGALILVLNINFLQSSASPAANVLFYVSLGIAGLLILFFLYIFPVIAAFANTVADGSNAGAVLTFTPPVPFGYGRIELAEDGTVNRIIEQKDCTPEQAATLLECNAGCYAFDGAQLAAHINEIGNDNAQSEYYLPDMLEILKGHGQAVSIFHCDDYRDGLGVNSRIQLAQLTAIARDRINEHWMAEGVTFIDPTQAWIGPDATIGRDTVVWPQTHLIGHVTVGEECQLGPNSRLTDTTVGSGCTIDETIAIEAVIENGVDCGPRAYLRPGTHMLDGSKAGTHVEIKKSTIGEGSKVPHLSYIGDTTMGSGVNVGAGSITCNYDGVHKHKTVIGKDAFIGSDTMMVAPAQIGDGALVAAGSVITEPVPADALGLGRARQVNIEGWAADYRRRLHEDDEV